MNSEEKVDFSKLKSDVVEMKDSLQLVKRAIMGDLKDNAKGILENIRKLQEEHEENKRKIDQLIEKTNFFEENIGILKEASEKINKLSRDFESLSKFKWLIFGAFACLGYILTHLSDFLVLLKSLLGIK